MSDGVNVWTQVINVTPRTKQRPRMTRRGRVYTPAATTDFENAVREAYEGPMFEGDVHLTIVLDKDKFVIEVEEYESHKSGLRGDIDNYVKSICDGLNGAAWKDDRQVKSLEARK